MKRYQVGKTYELAFLNTIVKDAKCYIVASDGENEFTIKPYEYQVDYSTFPKQLTCYVRNVNLAGTPYFEQSREAILKERYYTKGAPHSFVIDESCIDKNTNRVYYVLSDEFGITHRYYPKSDESIKMNGETINLIVNGIVAAQAGKNNARLDLSTSATDATSLSQIHPVYPEFTGQTYFGTEDAKKEFKSSIVYPAGETGANIDKQLDIISRTIAGFMNAEGGTLYIGVTDSGYVCGIENDYDHLNDGDDHKNYKKDDDHYMLKVMNRILHNLGQVAGTLLNMRIDEADGKKYCIIDIKKATRPIWFDGSSLYVRMVTTNRKLKGDEITQFILDRLSKESFLMQKEAEKPVHGEEEDDVPVSKVKTKPQTTIITKPSRKAWRNITFFSDGDWSFQKDELNGKDVVCNAIIPEDARKNNLILILAYENGHVEATYLSKVLYGKNGLLPGGKRRGQGLYLDNGKVIAAFCAKKKDMLLLTSELNGDRFIKAMDVDTLGIHSQMGQGNGIVREEGATLVEALRIPNDDGARISLKGSGVFIEKNQKYTKGGVKLNDLAPGYRTLYSELTKEAM